jgi:hypothetical protein
MRTIFAVALLATGIGLAGTLPTTAAPASGAAIAHAAGRGQVIDQVHWWRRHHRHHRHCWSHHGRPHCSW